MTDPIGRPDPYADVVARLRAGGRPQRQDSTLDQLRDLVPVADALGCRDAADLMRRMAGEGGAGPMTPDEERRHDGLYDAWQASDRRDRNEGGRP